MRKALAIAAVLFMASRFVSAAEKIHVVLSSDLYPYQEALQGIKEVASVESSIMTSDDAKLPPGVTVVIAVGGRAAVARYPDDVFMVYCLAPAVTVERPDHAASAIKIFTSPNMPDLISNLKTIQPELKTLGIIWMSDSVGLAFENGEIGKRKHGVTVDSRRLTATYEIPSVLRSFDGKVDAVWLPPDPAIVTPEIVETISEFSRAASIPFYAPVAGLVSKGATASVSSTFKEIGRTAGRTAQSVSNGTEMRKVVFPFLDWISLNLKQAAIIKLKVPEKAIEAADEVKR